jgi:hypothetical protein
MPSPLKSLASILAGFLVVVILSIVTDQILHATGIMPRGSLDTSMALLALAYRTVYTVIGSYVTARLAPRHPMRHAVILGCIGTLAGTAGALATRDLGLGPAWYAWALAVEALPCAWVGAKLYRR